MFVADYCRLVGEWTGLEQQGSHIELGGNAAREGGSS